MKVNFKTADMYRVSNGQLVEHWDVIEILDMLTAIGAISFNSSPATSFNGTNTTNSNNDGIPQQ
jgi:hypothetical protein